MSRERELQAKGYRFYQSYNYMQKDEAKAKASELRKQGYRATVMESKTSVKGIHNFVVWVK